LEDAIDDLRNKKINWKQHVGDREEWKNIT